MNRQNLETEDHQNSLPNLLPVVENPQLLEQALNYKFTLGLSAVGEITWPCIPAMVDNYVNLLIGLFLSFGRPMPAHRQTELRNTLLGKLNEGFAMASTALITVQYQTTKPPETGVACQFILKVPPLTEHYHSWLNTKTDPLFGSHPDAKVMAIASLFEQYPHLVNVLDIGGGVGRNALPLGRMGFRVQVLELTEAFAQHLQNIAQQENLPINVLCGDILDPLTVLPPAHFHWAIASEILTHFRSQEQLRLFFAKMCDYLPTHGLLVVNMFVCLAGYEPSLPMRQMAEVAWSSIFTYSELAEAIADLPLQIISDELAIEYERANLPAEAWPPTKWYETWATGRDITPIANFRPPIELRWIVLQRY
jgi:hypothetical protein